MRRELFEEEHELFPKVAQMKLDLRKLGEDMRLRREELFVEIGKRVGRAWCFLHGRGRVWR